MMMMTIVMMTNTMIMNADNFCFFIITTKLFQIKVTPWRDGEAPYISGGGLQVLQIQMKMMMR